jgi:hypothetical protein
LWNPCLIPDDRFSAAVAQGNELIPMLVSQDTLDHEEQIMRQAIFRSAPYVYKFWERKLSERAQERWELARKAKYI